MKELVLVKVSTSNLIDTNDMPDEASFMNIANAIKAEKQQGADVMLVTSGAISFGAAELGVNRSSYNDDVDSLSALAALGQVPLTQRWRRYLEPYHACQNLITPYELNTAEGATYIRKLRATLAMDLLPIANENDAVADDEIRFGDNDRLMAAIGAGLQRLGEWSVTAVILSDVDGLYTKNPNESDAELVRSVDDIDAAEQYVFEIDKEHNAGGMKSKLEAAKILQAAGVNLYLGDGRAKDPIARLVRGTSGTCFRAA